MTHPPTIAREINTVRRADFTAHFVVPLRKNVAEQREPTDCRTMAAAPLRSSMVSAANGLCGRSRGDCLRFAAAHKESTQRSR